MERTLLLFLLFLPICASAQLKVISESDSAKTIAKIYTDLNDTRHSIVEVKHLDGSFYLSAATTNRYDGRFIFQLGDTMESAAQTLRDLAGLCDLSEVGTRFDLERVPGFSCRCTIVDKNGKTKGKPTMLVFGADGFAGIVIIKKNQMGRIADMVEKYNGEL